MTANRIGGRRQTTIGGRALALGALSAALLAACASTGAARGGRHHEVREVAANDPRHPAVFVPRTRERMDAITRNISDQVAAGDLPHDALVTADGQRRYIEELLTRYGADGFFDDDERRDVATQLVLLRELRDHVGVGEMARGGGPVSDDDALWR